MQYRTATARLTTSTGSPDGRRTSRRRAPNSFITTAPTQTPIAASPRAARLIEGVRFNDEIHKLPTGNTTFIPKGVYHFCRHEDANRHWQDCVSEGMAKIALERM
jgi:hypothetical protein